jgi:hypothetical protein
MKDALLFPTLTALLLCCTAPFVHAAARSSADSLPQPAAYISTRNVGGEENGSVFELPSSDHNMLVLKIPPLFERGNPSDTFTTVVNLNMAQSGRLSWYGKDNWGSTLRTPKILRWIDSEMQENHPLAHFQKQIFAQLAAFKQEAIAAGEEAAAVEKFNSWIERWARDEFIPQLRERGLVLSNELLMSPAAALNAGVSSQELKSHPDEYFQIPSFVLEDRPSFTRRSRENLWRISAQNPDIVLVQEFETGSADTLSLAELGTLEHFSFVDPRTLPDFLANRSNACAITLFSAQKYRISEDPVEMENAAKLQETLQILFNFEGKPNKLNVLPLVQLQDGATIYVANMHLSYSSSNLSPAFYRYLAGMLFTVPGLIIGGDLNVTAYKHLGQQWLAPLHKSAFCSLSALTPEANVFASEGSYPSLQQGDYNATVYRAFNPTWDGIYAARQNATISRVAQSTINTNITALLNSVKEAQTAAKAEDANNWYKVFAASIAQ